MKMVDAVLYGTPSNLPQAESWTAYTTEGNFGFQGLALDAYLDCEIRFLARDGEMIAMRELVSEDVVYENIWLAETDGRSFKAYLGTAYREFPVSGKLGDVSDMAGNLADLHMEGGKLRKITMKKERISGKVLSVTEDAIEIEGYGEIPVSENFHVYKVYGDFKILGINDILVGYDLQEFVAADGKLCAALLETLPELLITNDLQKCSHSTARLLVNKILQIHEIVLCPWFLIEPDRRRAIQQPVPICRSRPPTAIRISPRILNIPKIVTQHTTKPLPNRPRSLQKSKGPIPPEL